MDLSLILASTRTQAQLRLGSDKANKFVGIPYAVEYGMVLHILQVPQKVSGDVWHHCDQILTYTSGVILGIGIGYRKTREWWTRWTRHNYTTSIATQAGQRHLINTIARTHFQHSDRDNL